jgi:hypothetical protein
MGGIGRVFGGGIGRVFGGGGRILDGGGGRRSGWRPSSGSRQVRWLHHGGEREKREGEERERGERMAYRWALGGAGCPRVCVVCLVDPNVNHI